MPNERISVNSTFGLLNDGQSRWGSFATSMVANVTVLILLLIIGAIHHQVVVKKTRAEQLYFPVEPKQPRVEVPKVKVVAPPKLEIAKVEPPKPVKLDPKPVLNIPPAPPKAVTPPPAPKVGAGRRHCRDEKISQPWASAQSRHPASRLLLARSVTVRRVQVSAKPWNQNS